jgi:hypothetical protein
MNSQNILEAMEGLALILDRNLIVRNVGWRNWNAFWTKNGGVGDAATVLGRDITDFISKGEVRDTYRQMFLGVMAGTRHSVKIDYRCDSPVLKRSMRLAVTIVPGDTPPEYLLYQSTILAIEQRPAIPLFGAPFAGPNWPNPLKICAGCAKVQWPMGSSAPDAEWIEPQEYYRRGGSDLILMSHGFCRPCYEAFMIEEDLVA